MLVKCPYCPKRMRARELPAHEKHCIYKKKAIRKQNLQVNTQTYQDRYEVLKQFPNYDYFPGTIKDMSDIAFKDLVFKLNAIQKESDEFNAKKQKEEKLSKREQKKQEKLEKERKAQAKLDAEEAEKKRLEQAEKAEAKRKAEIEAKEQRQNEVAEKLATPEPEPETDPIELMNPNKKKK